MRQLRSGAIVTLVGVLACPAFASPPDGKRAFLLVVDDLHFEFRSTPRMREVIRRVLNLLRQEGDSVAIVSTGQSSVAVAPTSNLEHLTSRLSRITGGGLNADQNLEPQRADERLSRARIAIATARDAIRVVASRTTGPVAVLYFSGGYAEQSGATDLAELASDAYRANATIYVFEPYGFVGGPRPPPSKGNESAWAAYHRDAVDSLKALANATGGSIVSTPSEFDSALAQITARE